MTRIAEYLDTDEPDDDPVEEPPAPAYTNIPAHFARQLIPAPWMDDAACKGEDTELFFPSRGESTEAAKTICDRCPVRQPCLDYALDVGEKFGIFGGTSERERRRMRARNRRP